MDRKKTGTILSAMSLVPVMISIIIFYTQRGPNADIYFFIYSFSILSFIGILFAVFPWVVSKRLILLIVSLLGNGGIFVCAFLLLLAMGISES